MHTRQGSAGGARNVGVAHARGDWFAFLDDDDVWLPHKLRACRAVIAAHPQARWVFSGAQVCDHHLVPSRPWVWGGPAIEAKPPYDAFLDDDLCPSAVLLHRTALAAVGPFETDPPRAQDRDMWFRLTLAGVPCAATHEPLVLYRERATPDGELALRAFADNMTILRRYFAPDKPRPPWRRRRQVLRRVRAFYARWLLAAAWHALRARRPRPAARYLARALAASPPRVVRSAAKVACTPLRPARRAAG